MIAYFYFYNKKWCASFFDYFDVSWNSASAKILLLATIVTIRNSPMNPHRRFISKENIFHHNFVILKVREGRRIPCVYPREISIVPCRYCILFHRITRILVYLNCREELNSETNHRGHPVDSGYIVGKKRTYK